MPPRPDPLETMTPADKLLRVGTFASLALLLVFVVVSSFSSGPDRPASAQRADVNATAADASPLAENGVSEAAEQVELAVASAESAATSEQDAIASDPAVEMPDTETAGTAERATPEDTAEVAAADSDVAPDVSESVNWLDDALLASADIARGESAFRQCSTCHQYAAERNAGGPHLVGIVGRPVGAVENWRYSDALQEADGIWTPDRLNSWLTDPNAYLPGNRMSYPGVRSEQERIDIIAFLAAQNES